jgi:dienelactone hydrolase
MHAEPIVYQDQETELEGYLAYDPAVRGARPLVLVAHAWFGQTDFERRKAEELAALGYAGFALDVFGKGVVGRTRDECAALVAPFFADRARLRQRLRAGLNVARALDVADRRRVAAIGFCFGGLCVLDLARGGDDLRGVVSFHGLLDPSDLPGDPPRIRTRILAEHGFEDPLAPPDRLLRFAAEMTARDADWQVHLHGRAAHAFTHRAAEDPAAGNRYDPRADARSWRSMVAFLAEVLAG